MVHSAYDSFQIVRDVSSRIESAASWSSKLLLACADGSLRVYSPPSDHLAAGKATPSKDEPYVLERTLAGFCRKGAAVTIRSLGSRNLLLSLSDSVAFHRLPSLEPATSLSKTKGANVYNWDERRGFLAVARQRKLLVYRHEGGKEFTEVKEFNVPDVIKSMVWCGENICLGIRKEYMIMNSTTGALSEVFPCGRLSAPLITSLPSGGLLLGKDNIGVFVDQNGKLLQEGRVCWSEPPASVTIQIPYALARLPRHIEIRSLRAPYQLVQIVALRDIRHLVPGNGYIIAVLDSSVHGFLPVPLGAQIVQLAASGNFEEALDLCEMLPPEDSTLRASKERTIHLRYAHYLFDNGSYEEAMEQFSASKVEITYVLSLYPFIALPKALVGSGSGMQESPSDDALLSRMSSDVSDDMEVTSSRILDMPVDSDDKATSEQKMSHNATVAVIKFLQKKRNTIIARALSEGTEEVVADAVQGSIAPFDYYQANRPRKTRDDLHINSGAREIASVLDSALIQALLLTGQSSIALELLKVPNYCDIKVCEDFLRQKQFFLVLVELFKCNEMHREALTLLSQLVEKSETTQSDHPKFSPEMIIEYLKPLGGTDPMLVLDFSLRILQSRPAETVDLFLAGGVAPDLVNSYLKQHAPHMQATYLEYMLSMNEHAITTNLQNELIQFYLSQVLEWYATLAAQRKWDEKEYSPARRKLLSALESTSGYNPEILLKRLPVDALYEERALLLGKMQQHQLALSLYIHKLHQPELALAYCDRVYENVVRQPGSKAASNIYLTLLQIYLNPKKSTKEVEQRMLNLSSPQVPGNQKVGVATKGRGGRSTKKFAEIGAEDSRWNSSSTDSGKSDADADADEMNREDRAIMTDEAIDLLSRKWNRINGAQALRLLPRNTKLQNLLPFLDPLLKKSSEGRRNYSVISSLRQSENLQVKEEFYKNRRKMVTIGSDSMCTLCNKRIGTSVFAVYPNGSTLVHFVCFRDSQNMKAVRGGAPVTRNS